MSEEHEPLPPGSDAAIKAGCTCPVIDNHYGRGYYGQSGVYVYSGGCPVHNMPGGEREEER